MSIDGIILSPELRSRLYQNNITNLKNPVEKRKINIPFTGENKRKILIVYDATLNSEDRGLLDNLIKACLLSKEDIALVDFKDQEATIPEIVAELKIQKAIFFGLPALSVGVALKDEAEDKVIEVENVSYLKTAPLGSLNKNIPRKKALWMALKSMFGI